MTLSTDIAQLAGDAAIVHSWVTGGPTTTVAMGAGQVRSVAKLIADKDAEINISAGGILAQSVAQVGFATQQALLATSNGATQVSLATAQSQAATAAKVAAEVARDAAAASWTAALAANPDLNPAVKMNPSNIDTDLTIPSFYNASSVGPLTIDEGVQITINDSANWSILL